jgi:hypothetical protein
VGVYLAQAPATGQPVPPFLPQTSQSTPYVFSPQASQAPLFTPPPQVQTQAATAPQVSLWLNQIAE